MKKVTTVRLLPEWKARLDRIVDLDRKRFQNRSMVVRAAIAKFVQEMEVEYGISK